VWGHAWGALGEASTRGRGWGHARPMVMWGRGAPWALGGLVGRPTLRHATCCCCLLELCER
jgi:hypothetical protein